MTSENSPGRNETELSFMENLDVFRFEKAQHIAFSSGIELLSLDYTTNSILEYDFSQDQSPIGFYFHLSGHFQAEIAYSTRRREQMEIKPGEAIIGYYPEYHSRSKLFDSQRYRSISINISPDRLLERLDKELDQVPAGLQRILQKNSQLPYNQKIKTSPHDRMVLDQIINCPYHGALKKLYLECKCLELMVSQLSEATRNPVKKCRLHLSPRDRERIHFAREIMLSDPGTPPSLNELAKKTGLNEHKLKRGFKQEFGTTVYKFYQTYRLKQSKEILDEGRLNIDETAQYLGFFDTSHFINHFKNYFGTTPGAYLKNGQSCR